MEQKNYNIVQGDSWSLNLKYVDSSGSAVPLIGYSVLMQVKNEPGGRILCASASVNSTSASGTGIIVDRANGIIDISLTPTQTKSFTYPQSAYQIRIDNGLNVETLQKGWFIVDAGVID